MEIIIEEVVKFWVIFGSVFLIAVILLSFIGTWKNAIEKDYLSRLTPEERAEISAQKEAEQLELEEQGREQWKGIADFFSWKIPLWFVILLLAGTWIASPRRRWI